MHLILFSLMMAGTPVDKLLNAMERVESGGNVRAIGDGGRSRGPLQIQRAYHRDSGVPGDYLRVHERGYARKVGMEYWRRWCPDALRRGDIETLARVHNGGPRGNKIKATQAYWAKVKRQMRKDEQ